MPEVLYPALDWLAERGVQSVSVSYDGSGDEGLIEDEKFWLGTRSLDHTVRPWDTRHFPEMTRQVAALVRAVGS